MKKRKTIEFPVLLLEDIEKSGALKYKSFTQYLIDLMVEELRNRDIEDHTIDEGLYTKLEQVGLQLKRSSNDLIDISSKETSDGKQVIQIKPSHKLHKIIKLVKHLSWVLRKLNELGVHCDVQ